MKEIVVLRSSIDIDVSFTLRMQVCDFLNSNYVLKCLEMYIFQNPGPAAYKLPPPDVNKAKAPAFTMRVKEKGSKVGPVSPGPVSNYYHMVSNVYIYLD